MRARLIISVLAVGILAMIAVVLAIARPPAINPVVPPAANSFPADLVERGRVLALIGDCNVCHTRPDGVAFAGGRALPTPFGTIYASNITPDVKTGLGNWSRAAFARAMREGISRDGQFIYPAHPYDHCTLLTDDDLAALYAYLMTRAPIDAVTPVPELRFPYSQRQLMAGWNLLFLRQGPYRPDPTQSAEWNRGAYLVQGVGHCGACHTPRNIMGAEQKDRAFAGAVADGWYAPPLNGNSLALVPWTADSLTTYLSRGHEFQHGIAGGPMADVAADLDDAPMADVQAIATYVAWQMGTPSGERDATARARLAATEQEARERRAAMGRDQVGNMGEIIYAAACAQCHEPWTTDPPQNAGRGLALQTAVTAAKPNNLIYTLINGIRAPDDISHMLMPDFARALTDTQIAELARYVRRSFSDQPAWPDLEAQVAQARTHAAHQIRED
jgi:mono/diheme cytochrome c family protein